VNGVFKSHVVSCTKIKETGFLAESAGFNAVFLRKIRFLATPLRNNCWLSLLLFYGFKLI